MIDIAFGIECIMYVCTLNYCGRRFFGCLKLLLPGRSKKRKRKKKRKKERKYFLH